MPLITVFHPGETHPCCVCCAVVNTVPQECCDEGCKCHWYRHPVYSDPDAFVDRSGQKEVKVSGWAGKEKS